MVSKRTAKSSGAGKKIPSKQGNKSTAKNVGTDSPKKSAKLSQNKEEAPTTSFESSDSKMTLCTLPTNNARQARRPGRPASGKRPAMTRELSGKVRSAYKRSLDPCDNSNDSGLGFDHHADPHQHSVSLSERLTWSGERAEVKRQRMDIKLENDDINEGYCFPDTLRSCKDNISLIRTAPGGTVPHLTNSNNNGNTSGRAVPRCIPLSSRQSSSAPVPLTSQLSSGSRYIDVSLTILKQPEQQHRARYQTEGSRGAVKDRDGNGFPVVQLTGYYKPATLQVFIGTDVGKVAPHMFYQACKVSGKNSTPCLEKKIDGTCVIELQLDPSKEMSATCDCVGILKERNVDVEHRFPEQLGNRSKKKSTKCRMIFRTTITLDDGTQETLQVCSHPIVCTQPPGVPEICKKSLTACPASGGLELFVLGKNFLKDTKVYFQQFEDGHLRWEQNVVPDKEYLQQTHFVCVVPPYRRQDITEPVSVRLCVLSSGKTSESHQFVYTPVNGAIPSVHMDAPATPVVAQPTMSSVPFFKSMIWQSSSVNKREQDLDMMPPPESSMVPMSTRRSSISVPSTSEVHSPPLRTLKQEYIDENSQNSMEERYRHVSESSLDVHPGDSNMSLINENSMDVMHHNNMMNHLNENSNVSITNDDSVEMIRRNSLSRSVCENSLDMNNSNMSTINEDSSCSTVMHSVLSQPNHLLTTVPEKVIDLRMKLPMTTVTDIVSAPSMATLQRFGMIDQGQGPLPTQSAQSVENYLTKIELKLSNPNSLPMKTVESILHPFNAQQVINAQTCGILTTTTSSLSNLGSTTSITEPEAVFLTTQRQFLSNTTQNDAINIVAKSEAAAVAEASNSEQAITTIASSMDTTMATTINTERLDDLVNSTVESHIGSPITRETSPKNVLASVNPPPEVIITPQDVMLNPQNSLMVPPIINTRLPSPVLQQEPNLTPDVILNNQIPPSLMCRSTTDDLLPPGGGDASLLPVSQQSTSGSNSPESIASLHSPIAVALRTEPEKAVLLEAAVDLFETQKKISELQTSSNAVNNDILTMATATNSQLQSNPGNNFVHPQFVTTASTNLLLSKNATGKPDFDIPVPVKEMVSALPNDKKNEDTMIPQSFTSLTENELINLINPSCFDEGNNNNYE